MFKHASKGRGYEVYRVTRDGRRIFRAKGTIAISRLYAEEEPPPVEPDAFALEEYVRGKWFKSKTQMILIESAHRLAAALPRQFRVVYPARRVFMGKGDSIPVGLTTGLSYDLERK
jgi:hypothetical protein